MSGRGIYKRKQHIERITIIGPMEKAKELIQWCYDNQYNIKRTGPKLLKGREGSITEFKIIAEREIK